MKKEPRQLKDGECPKCGSFETFFRQRIMFGDVSYLDFMTSGFKQPVQMVRLEFHCRDCGHEDVIYGRDDLKKAIQSLKRGLKNAKTKEEKAAITKEIKHWQAIHDGADRIPRGKRLGGITKAIKKVTKKSKKK